MYLLFTVFSALHENHEEATSRSTPVGPVAGGIMGCFLVLALSVYCYRHRIHRNAHQYISTLPENQNRMSHYYDTDDIDPVEELGNGNQSSLILKAPVTTVVVCLVICL